MNVLAELRRRFHPVLAALAPQPEKVAELLEMIRPSQDAKFGDYQANFAMPLKNLLGKPPREIAEEIVAKTKLDDMFQPAEIAGPGFINLRVQDAWLAAHLQAALGDERLGVAKVEQPRTYVVDYSSPNVAKAMHVGHIRSTVIGAALDRTLRFLGHRVISDNHLGDWGTQFGMIIYGYKHFADAVEYEADPVKELGRLYKLVHKLVDYRESQTSVKRLHADIAEREANLSQLKTIPTPADKQAEKKAAQALRRAEGQLAEKKTELAETLAKIAAVENDPKLAPLIAEHPHIEDAVLAETAKLHAGDAENRRLWEKFLPECRKEIQRVYKRLNVSFDHELGESFFHDRLEPVAEDFIDKGFAKESEGALCVFLDGFDAPMIIRKKDGAFLYATTDLATIQYRMTEWKPDAILYVVDHRQGEHFEKLFAAARLWGYDKVELKHVSFGTVLGDDGKPYKTRSGDTVGLEGLLDEAVSRAAKILEENSDDTATMSDDDKRRTAESVGIGAIKYADLSQNRTSDYTFSYDKMLAMNGNTAAYMQYCYVRVNGIFARGGIDRAAIRSQATPPSLATPEERSLGIQLVRFSEVLADTTVDYRPNLLTAYLFDLSKAYAAFFENCPVLKAESEELRTSRLQLCDLTARTIRRGLEILGIQTVERM